MSFIKVSAYTEVGAIVRVVLIATMETEKIKRNALIDHYARQVDFPRSLTKSLERFKEAIIECLYPAGQNIGTGRNVGVN